MQCTMVVNTLHLFPKDTSFLAVSCPQIFITGHQTFNILITCLEKYLEFISNSEDHQGTKLI